MSIITLNNRAINRSDTAVSGEVFTATSATASDYQAPGMDKLASTAVSSDVGSVTFDVNHNNDSKFNNYKRSYLEIFRFIIGGFLLSYFFRFIRHVQRASFNSRTVNESGLYIEDPSSKKYKIKYIKKGRVFHSK